MKKKIMHISQANGGVAKYLQMLFKYINIDEYEQILVYPNEYIYEKENFDKLVDEIEFLDMYREINFVKDSKSVYQIYKLIKKYNPDLIYLHSSKAGALGRIANTIIGKPIIYNPHGWAFNMDVSNRKKYIYKFIEKILSRKCDKIIAISEYEKKAAIKNRICNEDKIQVIFNGIDIKEYKSSIIDKMQFRLNNKIPQNSLVVGMVGRISRQKSPDVFIKAAAKIKEKVPNTFFIIVGDGEQRHEVEELIKELGLENFVLITGWVKNTYEYIQSFDIGMLLSKWEGFGLAIVEYMISGVPVIANNIDAIPDIINNKKNGILVEVNDIDQIVNAFMKIIKNEEFTNNIIRNGKDTVIKHFNIERVALEHEKIFKKYGV